MVCPPQESTTSVTVRDERKQCYVHISKTKSVESIFREISKEFDYNIDEIELTFRRGTSSVSTIQFLVSTPLIKGITN